MKDPVVIQAWELAAAAAARAGVTIALVSDQDIAHVLEVFAGTWGAGRSGDFSLIKALVHSGNPVLLARNGKGEPCGALLSFLGWGGGIHVHSHQTAAGLTSRGMGAALKLAQRASCLEQGVNEIRWTYDPLIRRNAHFNLTRLGARVIGYHEDFYGLLDDPLNAGDYSDRFEVSWELRDAAVIRALSGRSGPKRGDGVRFELEPDFESMRRADPAKAVVLRRHSREVFRHQFGERRTPHLDSGDNYVFCSGSSVGGEGTSLGV